MKKKAILLLFVAVVGLALLFACEVASPMLYVGPEGTYYRGSDGKNITGFVEIDDKIYYFGDDGRMVKEGMLTIDDAHYLFRNGEIQTGWQEYAVMGGETAVFYFLADGKAATGERVIDDKTHKFGADGILISEQEHGEPATTPTSTPAQNTEQGTEPPSQSTMAVGEKTGNERLDTEVKKIIDAVCDPEKDAEWNLGELFDWMVEELKYKYITVDISRGYTESLVTELAEYIVLNRRGSCENQAALMCVFIERMGYEAQVIPGEFLSDDKTEWVEHAWVIANVGGSNYHFDPLFGRNHTQNPRSFFMKKDADIESLHRWDRENNPVCD